MKVNISKFQNGNVSPLVAEEDSRSFFPNGGKRWEILRGEEEEKKATHHWETTGGGLGLCRRKS